MNLIVDIGNTNVKVAVFEEQVVLSFLRYENIDVNILMKYFSKYSIQRAIVSTVANYDGAIVKYLRSRTQFVEFSHLSRLPITLKYKTPTTLGLDRIAAAVGAYCLCPNKNVLIIDAGSAVTFDVLNSESEFIGGNISLGLNMRFEALSHFTAKLPRMYPQENFEQIGQSTADAIVAGVQMGMIAEIEAYINNMKDRFRNFEVIMTGGDAQFFEKKIKSRIFVNPYLVLIGLNKILECNI